MVHTLERKYCPAWCDIEMKDYFAKLGGTYRYKIQCCQARWHIQKKDHIAKFGETYTRKNILARHISGTYIQQKANFVNLGGTNRRKTILPSLLVHKDERQYCQALWYKGKKDKIAKLGCTYRRKTELLHVSSVGRAEETQY